MDLIQQSSSLFGSLKNAVMGNQVLRDFTLGQQVASFGPGLLWKVFDGKKKSTGQVRLSFSLLINLFVFHTS